MYAVVNPNGTLARGFRAVGSNRISAGSYEVEFNRDVRRCAYVATIGLSGDVGVSPSGELTVVAANGDPSKVFVATSSSSGGRADRGFHLAVHCRP
jgi:hypothetical protein